MESWNSFESEDANSMSNEFFHIQGHDGTYTKLQEIQDFQLPMPDLLKNPILSVPFYK